MNKLFICLYATVLASSLLRAEISEHELEARSDLWPLNVQTTEEIQAPEGVRTLKTGTRGILLRVENGKVILDTGRWGILAIPIAQTNILELAHKVASEEVPKQQGNVVSMLGGKFFDPQDERYQPFPYFEFQSIDYFLFYYTNSQDEACIHLNETLRSDYEAIKEAFSEVEILMIPLDESNEAMLKAIKEQQIPWPTMFHYMAKGYQNALHHEPKELPCLVLTDANGKVLAHSLKDYDQNNPEAVLALLKEKLTPNLSENAER